MNDKCDIILLLFSKDSERELLFGILYLNTHSDYLFFIVIAFKYFLIV